MMNRKIIYIALAAVALAGCGKDNGLPDNTGTELQLNVGIGEMDSRAVAIKGTSFARESRINIVLTDFDGGTTRYNTSGAYIYKEQGVSGVWLYDGTAKALQLNEYGAMALAHYPAQLPATASYNVTTKLFTPVITSTLHYGDLIAGEYNADNSFWFSFKNGDPQTEVFMADGEIDYMYGKMTNTSAISNVNKLAQIKMNHTLTMVVFNTFKSDLNPTDCVVKSIKVKNINSAKALSAGTFSIYDGTFTASTTTEYFRTMDNFPDKSYFGMMMFPANIKDNEVVVEFLVDNQTYTLPIAACEWKSGYVNLYRVKFTPVGAELVGAVRIADWGTEIEHNFEIN